MIKKLKLAALTVAMTVSFGAQAGPFWFDADGAGTLFSAVRIDGQAPITTQGNINSNGGLAVNFSYSDPNPLVFQFTQSSNGLITGFDNNGFGGLGYDFAQLVDIAILNQIQYSLAGTGTGVLGSGISFTGGTLSFNRPSASAFAVFDIVGGSAVINSTGAATGSTELDLVMDKSASTAGYFFNDYNGAISTDWTDLDVGAPVFGLSSTVLANAQNVITTNSQFDPRPATLTTSVASVTTFEVPEPASLALVGLGLLAAGALRRRKAA